MDVFIIPVGPVDEQEGTRLGKLGNCCFEFLLFNQFFVHSFQGLVPETQFVLLVETLVQDSKDVNDVGFFVEVVCDLD